MTFATILLAAEEVAHEGNVMGSTLIFGVIAAIVFAFLGLVTVSYRNVANRHPQKAEAYAKAHAHELQPPHGHGH